MSDYPLWSEYCDSCLGPSPSACSGCEHSFYCPRFVKERDVEAEIRSYIKAMKEEILRQLE